MTEIDLAAIEARVQAATPGPWHQDGYYLCGPGEDSKLAELFLEDEQCDANMSFIAHAITDIPLLIAHVKELEAALEEWRTGEIRTDLVG